MYPAFGKPKNENKDLTVAQGNWTIAQGTGQQREELDSSARNWTVARGNWTVARGNWTVARGTGQQREDFSGTPLMVWGAIFLWHPYFLGWPNIFSEKNRYTKSPVQCLFKERRHLFDILRKQILRFVMNILLTLTLYFILFPYFHLCKRVDERKPFISRFYF